MRLLLLIVALALPASAQESSDLFESLYAEGQRVQATTTSIGAEFTETTVSSLLVEPIVARGTLIAAAPGRLVMDYATGQRQTVIVSDDRLTVRWPDQGRQETRMIDRTRERVGRYFGDASPRELRRLFDIEAATDPDHPDTYRIDMSPRRDEIREGLTTLQIWVNQSTVLMERMFMVFPGGDSKLIELHDMRLNVPVDDTTFAIPAEPGRE